MKKANIFFWLLLLSLSVISCISEDYDNCPKGYYIRFYPQNQKHDLKQMINTVDLYLYGEDGSLHKEIHRTKEELRPADGAVFIPLLPAGEYKVLALINHDPSCYEISSYQKFEEVHTSLPEELIKTPPADLFVGIKPLEFKQNEKYAMTVPMKIAKQTNHINLKIVFQDYEQPADAILNSHIYGSNGKFEYSTYSCSNIYRKYIGHKKDSSQDTNAAFQLTTMRLWAGADINLVVEEEYPSLGETRSVKINLVEELMKVKDEKGELLYDTDEKLEFNDEYDITMTLDGNFVLLELTIDNWTANGGGVEV